LRVAHRLVPAARHQAALVSRLTRQKVHGFPSRVKILEPTGLKSGAFGTIPGIVAAGSWRSRKRLTESPAARITAAMNGLNAICGICREIIR
jgi:hypothetical protein